MSSIVPLGGILGGISNWTIGQLSPIWTIPMVRDKGRVMDLTGVTVGQLSLIIYNSSKVIIGTGAGTFAITQVVPGEVTYQLAGADVPTVIGQYYIKVKVNFNGTTPDYCSYISWVLEN